VHRQEQRGEVNLQNMSNSYFQFKQFIIHQDRCAMKITTDACLFGAWISTKFQNTNSKFRTLDIGTGTGLLSLMYAQKNPLATIDAIEIDEESFKQAKENIASSSWSDRINIIHGDIKTSSFTKKYHLIVSNPPFYENELKSGDTKRNIALHSKELLLDKLLDIIKQNLEPDGKFYLLLPNKRNQEIDSLVKQKGLTIANKTFVRQSINHDYFRIIISGTHQRGNEREYLTSEISIWNDQQQYTKEFIKLLKGYYLHL
jgi:tRNA1Val (adenine37-N6)-methyltransferase